MNRTGWFIAAIDPVHIGWYECKMIRIPGVVMLHWSGHGWRYNPLTPRAEDIGLSFGKWPGDRWRGLTKGP